MTGYLEVECAWCEEKAYFEDPGSEDKWREAGWMQLQMADEEDDLDFCSKECCRCWLL